MTEIDQLKQAIEALATAEDYCGTLALADHFEAIRAKLYEQLGHACFDAE